MYESFYGLKEKPFSLQPDPDFIYFSKKHSVAYSLLEYGIFNQSPITVISGEIGSGKTTLIRYLLNQLNEEIDVGLISNTHKSFGELLTWVSVAFGIDRKDKDHASMYESFINYVINNYRVNKKTVLIVDEAQNMDIDTLEELRVISNVNADKDQVLQIILVGQPQLRDLLRKPELEQLSQRVAVDYHLDALTEEETNNYISHRLEVADGSATIFSPQARVFIYNHSDGVPRIINNLCDTALVYGYATKQKEISSEIITELINDRIQSGGGLLTKQMGKVITPIK